MRLYTRNSYVGVILDDMGLPASEHTKTDSEEIATYHSPERLLDLDADQILVATYDDGAGEVDEARTTTSPTRCGTSWRARRPISPKSSTSAPSTNP